MALNRLTRRNTYQSGAGNQIRLGPMTAQYLILGLLGLLSVFFLIQSAQGSDKELNLRHKRQKITELDRELTTLEVNVNRLKSINSVEKTTQKAGLVPIGENPETIIVGTPNSSQNRVGNE